MAAHEHITVSDFSPDQSDAYGGIMTWLNRGTQTKRALTFAGYAGTGKSTVVSVLAHELLKLGPIAFCAFTGKASSVLGRKLATSGIATASRVARKDPLTGARAFEPRPYCGTIHGLIYRPCETCGDDGKVYPHNFGSECKEPLPEVAPESSSDEDEGTDDVEGEDVEEDEEEPVKAPRAPLGLCLGCHPPPPPKREGPCRACNDARYFRRDTLDRDYKLITIDEASMVSDDMLDDLLRYGVPILAVGDHGQLPPVRGTGRLMQAPDLRLERIHRNAEGSPIIALSARIRETGTIDDRLEDGKAFTIIAARDLKDWIAKRWTHDRLVSDDPCGPDGALGSVLVSWTNKRRVALNYDVRTALGISADGNGPPLKGDVVICLKNKAPIYNGMRGVLVGDSERLVKGDTSTPKWRASIDFVEDGQSVRNILLSEHQFFAEKTLTYEDAQKLNSSMANLGELYDYGYALTAHKMQGSQAHEVCVVIEPGLSRMSREDRTKWLYTSCTRAAARLCVVR